MNRHIQGSGYIQSSDVTLMCVHARDIQVTAVGLHFLMLLMVFIMVHDIKEVSRYCAAVLPASFCTLQLSSAAALLPSLPTPFVFQLTFFYLTLGVSPFLNPELLISLSQRCSSCSSPSGSSSHSSPCVRLQLSTLMDVLGTPCMSAKDGYMANGSSVTPT
jgi:hypothetical protein